MALTAEGLQGTTNEVGGARRFYNAAVQWLVSGPGHFRVRPQTALQRCVEVSPGTGQCCGVMVRETGRQIITFDANTTSTDRLDVLCVRLTWGGGVVGSSRADYAVVKGSGSSLGTLQRTEGSVYDCPIAIVKVRSQASIITAADISPCAPYGGPGGIRIAGTDPSAVHGKQGMRLASDADSTTWEFRGSSWTVTSKQSVPWQTWVPTVRSSLGAVNLGNGGTMAGRYKVLQGWCLAEWEVRTGVSGWNFGRNGLTMDLPVAASRDHIQQGAWSPGHLYTTAEAPMDWPLHAYPRPGAAVADLFAPRLSVDCRYWPVRAADNGGGASTGVPWINGKYSDPMVMSGTLRYRVD